MNTHAHAQEATQARIARPVRWPGHIGWVARFLFSVASQTTVTGALTLASNVPHYDCSDIDECLPAPCLNGATCEDMVDGYNCVCATGYEGAECSIGEGWHVHLVHDNHESFIRVLTGRAFTKTIPRLDTDECASDPCKNGGVCSEGIGFYTCDCPDGYSGTNCNNGGLPLSNCCLPAVLVCVCLSSSN